MKQIQKWFEQIVGVAQAEEERRRLAKEIFSARGPSAEILALPACWRRAPRVIRHLGI